MPEAEYDYLIVGQGLAGSVLAWHLLDLDKKIVIGGDSSMPSSSRVAAGIFNPLTGKKLVKTWLADDIFPYAAEFYSNVGQKLGADLIHFIPVYRPFRSIEEQNNYLAQSGEKAISHYVAAKQGKVDISDYVHSAFGGLEVVRSGWVDLPLFLDKSRGYFKEAGIFEESHFDFNDFEIEQNLIRWKGRTFKRAIFCQGAFALENPLFSWLPFAPVKGQILDIATEVPAPPYIINQGIFALPVGTHTSRVGATYSWDPLDWQATEAATAEIREKLDALLKVPYQLKFAAAGIRPSVKDRRPLIGTHPEYGNVSVFNGLGTKGVTLGPFFANQLIQHLEAGKELNPLANISRYFSLYFR